MKRIDLDYPLTIQREPSGPLEEVRHITLGRLKAKHLKLMPKSMFTGDAEAAKNVTPEEMIPLIAGLANLPMESAEELDMVDLMKIATELGPFLSESLQVGSA